jgi:hypothetical protein
VQRPKHPLLSTKAERDGRRRFQLNPSLNHRELNIQRDIYLRTPHSIKSSTKDGKVKQAKWERSRRRRPTKLKQRRNFR